MTKQHKPWEWQEGKDENNNPYYFASVPNHDDPDAAEPSIITIRPHLNYGTVSWRVDTPPGVVLRNYPPFIHAHLLQRAIELDGLRTIEQLQHEQQKLISKVTALRDSINALIKKKYFVCPNAECGAKTPIGELTYRQTHWYERPYSCSGGDCYHESNGEIKCPKCGRITQLRDEHKQFADYRRHFKDEEKVYPRDT